MEGEWLDGVPHGVCNVENNKGRGIITFTNGIMSGGPEWFESK